MSFLAAKRYAEALFEIASEKSEIEQWQSHLQALKELFLDASVEQFLQSDRVPLKTKIETIKGYLKDTPPLVVNFACLLVSKVNTELIQEIAEVYNQLRAEHNGDVLVKIYTADKSATDITETIRTKLNALLNTEHLIIQEVVVPEMIGGIKIRIGDEVFDGSVFSGLRAIKTRLAAQAAVVA